MAKVKQNWKGLVFELEFKEFFDQIFFLGLRG